MPKLTLTLNTNYRPHWSLNEALREFVQNALDARDDGHELVLHREGGKRGTVHIKTIGTTLGRDKLLLGSTSKTGDARGCYGEGFKMAMLVLTRQGRTVTIATGNETWQCQVERSADFGGAETLMVYASRRATPKNEIDVRIAGISDEEWQDFLGTLLDVGVKGCVSATNAIVVPNGRILLDASLRGKLFVGGIYAGPITDSSRFGYDFKPSACRLDIDRKMTSTYDLQVLIRNSIESAVGLGLLSQAEVYDLCNGEGFEVDTLRDYAMYALAYDGGAHSSLRAAIVAEHRLRYGENALAATNQAAAATGAALGLHVVTTSPTIAAVMDSSQATNLAHMVSVIEVGVKRVVPYSELSSAERLHFDNAVAAVGLVRPELVRAVSVVEFYSTTMKGRAQFEGDTIEIAKCALTNASDAMATVIHEAAHLDSRGRDGSDEHRRAIERIGADLAVVLLERMGYGYVAA